MPALRSRLAFAAQAAFDVGDERLSAVIDLMLLWLLAAGHSEWRLLGSRRRSAAPWGDPRSIAGERIAQLSMGSPGSAVWVDDSGAGVLHGRRASRGRPISRCPRSRTSRSKPFRAGSHKRPQQEYSRRRAGPAARILSPSPAATNGASCATRREARVTGFDCGAGAVLPRALPQPARWPRPYLIERAGGSSPLPSPRGPTRGTGRLDDHDADRPQLGSA